MVFMCWRRCKLLNQECYARRISTAGCAIP